VGVSPVPNPRQSGPRDRYRAGRDTLLTTETAKRLCEARRLGLPKCLCARLVGVSRSSLFYWLERGKDGSDDLCRQFYIDFTRAHAEGAEDYLGIVAGAARGGCVVERSTRTDARGNVTVSEKMTPPSAQAAQWVLERRWNRDFGPNRLEVQFLEATIRQQEARIAKLEGTESGETPAEPVAGTGAVSAQPTGAGAPEVAPVGQPAYAFGTSFEL
jgi:hypothetical protein